MYLESLNNGLIVPDPGVELLSINNLHSVVYGSYTYGSKSQF